MTTAQTHSISAAQAVAAQLSGEEKKVALLRVEELRLARECQIVVASGLAEVCAGQHAMVGEGTDRRPNPINPYLTWSCCHTHMTLRDRKAELLHTAQKLGVASHFDANISIAE